MNHFQTLKLETSFALEANQLQQAYLAAQQMSHPDRQVGKDDAQRRAAALESAAANDAYRVLKDDYLRGVHLLELQGLKVSGDDAEIKPAPMVLMEVMELNEALAETDDVAVFYAKLKAMQLSLLSEITQSFAANASDDAAQQVIRLGYLNKTLEQAKRQL